MDAYTFLKGQHDDLVQAEETLQGIILQLDEAMRRQFQENSRRSPKSLTSIPGTVRRREGERWNFWRTRTSWRRGSVSSPSRRKETAEHDAAVRRRKGADRHCAAVRHPESEAVALLPAGRD